MAITTQKQHDLEIYVQKQKHRQIYIKIDILDTNEDTEHPLYTLESDSVDGTYSLDANSAIRRTCNLEFILRDNYLPSPTSPFWINRRFKLSIGILNKRTNNILWFNKGIYFIQNPEISISINDNKISISGIDKMALFNGDITGMLFENYEIPASTIDNKVLVCDAIEDTVQDQRYKENIENKIKIDRDNKNINTLEIPYKIETNMGSTKWDIIEEITNLYYNTQSYYDEDGYFCFNEKPMYEVQDYPISWDFRDDEMITNITLTTNYSNVKNVVKVYGAIYESGQNKGLQPSYTIEVDDINYPECIYNIQSLHEGFTRDLVIQEDSYKDEEQCKKRCESEVWLHQNASDTLNFTCVPIYSLNVNDVIYFEGYYHDNASNLIVGRFVIDSIQCGLSYEDLMSVTAHRLDNKLLNS